MSFSGVAPGRERSFSDAPAESSSDTVISEETRNPWAAGTRRPRGLRTWVVDPRRALHKQIVTGLLCCYVPGPYFMDAAVGAYKQAICASSSLDINSTTFSLLFALPSLIGVLSSPIGVIIARYGDARSSAVAGFVTLFAAAGCMFGLQIHSFGALLVFRIIFWFGLYFLVALQVSCNFKLYSGPNLAIVTGFQIGACRGGGMAGYITSGYLLDFFNGDVGKALSASVVAVGVALVATVSFWWLRGGTLRAREVIPGLAAARMGQESELPFLDQLRGFTFITWLLILQIAIIYGAIFPFETVEADILESDWHLDKRTVGWYASFGPSFGFIAWSFGICIRTIHAQLFFGVISWVLLTLSFLMLWMHVPSNPIWALGFFGLSYAYMSAALWSLLPFSLGSRKDECETASVTTSIVSFSATVALSNLITGFLHDHFNYGVCCLWFVLLSLAGTACSVWVFLWNCKNGSNQSPEEGVNAEMPVSHTHDATLEWRGDPLINVTEEHFPEAEDTSSHG